MKGKKIEKNLIKKQEIKEEIEAKEIEIEAIKQQRKAIARKITYAELPKNKRFDNVINQRKHFLDTIKLIAYSAETSLSNIIKQYMTHKDESRLLLKQIYKTDADFKIKN